VLLKDETADMTTVIMLTMQLPLVEDLNFLTFSAISWAGWIPTKAKE
jgi:hypothetical protein